MDRALPRADLLYWSGRTVRASGRAEPRREVHGVFRADQHSRPVADALQSGHRKQADGDHTLLRATLGADSLRAMFIGKPDRDPYRVQVIIARKSGGANVRQLQQSRLRVRRPSGALSIDVKYGRLAQDDALWETLTTTISAASSARSPRPTAPSSRLATTS